MDGERLHDAVDGRRGQLQPAGEFGNTEASFALEREEYPNCPVDRLNQVHPCRIRSSTDS
jgi:hypothetical protein